MARNQYIDRDNMYSDRMDADSGGEDFMGGQQLAPASIGGLPAGIAPAISGKETGISKLVEQSEGLTKQPYTFDELNQMLGQVKNAPSISDEVAAVGGGIAGPATGVAGLPGSVAPAMAAGQGSGIAELLAAPAAAPVVQDNAPKPTQKMLEAKEVSKTQFPGMEPTYGPDRHGEKGEFLGYKFPFSQVQKEGFVPVYSPPEYKTGGHGNQILVNEGGKFLGYQADPDKKIEVPKPAEILALEKKFGTTMDPIYDKKTVQHRGADGLVEYGPPTGYRFDNGKSQYVTYDTSGEYQGTQDRSNSLLPLLGILAMPFLGPLAFEAMGLGGAAAGAEALGAGALGAGAAFTPEMIAAGLTPGGIGAAGAASGALTGANLAAASGIGSLGAGALTGAAGLESLTPITETAAPAAETLGTTGGYGSGMTNPSLLSAGESAAGTAALPASEVASLGTNAAGAGGYGSGAANPSLLSSTGAGGAGEAGITTLSKALPSVNEMIASGTFTPGAAGALNAGTLTAEQLAAAQGLVTAGATPALVDAAAKGAQSYIDSGGASQAGAGGGPNGTDVIKEVSKNQAVASGLGPGQMGADLAAKGTLTAQELAAAAGTAGALNKDGIGDFLSKVKDKVLGSSDSSSGSGGMGLGGALGLMALMSMMNKGGGTPASTATIPELTATRSQLPYDVDKKGVNPNTPYRPGQGGVTYFSPTTYTPTPPKAAGGGLMSLGGMPNLGSYSDGGRLLQGPGDGVSDSIPAIIGRKQPARLANGEFVIPARIVSELGNGSTDAGAKRLYEMMDRVQKVRRKTKNVAANTKASKYLPA